MKIAGVKQIILDKKILTLSFLIAAALIAIITIFIFTGNYSAKNTSLRKQISNIQDLAGSVMNLKSSVDAKEKKIRSAKSQGAVSALEKILGKLGLTAAAIKPLDKKKVNNFMEEKAALEIQNTDLNSIVNLLYKIENSPVPMKINTAAIKTSFEDPDKFVLKMSVSLLSK
jgi:outer membrane murein-binding lipoprotein Lpp